MAKKRLFALTGLLYPKAADTNKKILAQGGTGAAIQKLLDSDVPKSVGRSRKKIEAYRTKQVEEYMAKNYIRVEAGEELKLPIPGTCTIRGKRVSVEQHYLATGRLTDTEPSEEG